MLFKTLIQNSLLEEVGLFPRPSSDFPLPHSVLYFKAGWTAAASCALTWLLPSQVQYPTYLMRAGAMYFAGVHSYLQPLCDCLDLAIKEPTDQVFTKLMIAHSSSCGQYAEGDFRLP